MRKIVIGFKFQREPFRSCNLYLVKKDLISGESQEISIAGDSWTNSSPETLSDRTAFLAKVGEFNHPDYLGWHRKLCWLKKKAFASFEEAEAYGRELFAKAEELYYKEQNQALEKELELEEE